MTPKMETPSLSWQSFIAEEQQEDEAGYKPLRETIQKQMKEAYGLQTRSEQIFITSGAQQALFLITQCLLKPGMLWQLSHRHTFIRYRCFSQPACGFCVTNG